MNGIYFLDFWLRDCLAAQVVSGIGFIGAGMYFIASMATLLALVCLETMHFLTRHYGEKSAELAYPQFNAEATACRFFNDFTAESAQLIHGRIIGLERRSLQPLYHKVHEGFP